STQLFGEAFALVLRRRGFAKHFSWAFPFIRRENWEFSLLPCCIWARSFQIFRLQPTRIITNSWMTSLKAANCNMRMERFRCPRVRDWESISIAKSSQNIVKCTVAWVRIRTTATRCDRVGRLQFQTNAGPILRMTADPKFLTKPLRFAITFRDTPTLMPGW